MGARNVGRAATRAAPTQDAHKNSFSRRIRARALPRHFTNLPEHERDGAPRGAKVLGHATRANVATRSRFGRGARHSTIRLREPPASGARRLPALHRGACRGGRPRPLRTALAPSVGGHRSTPLDERDFVYVNEIGTNVKSGVAVSVINWDPPLAQKSRIMHQREMSL